MTLDELERECPELRDYTAGMPADIRTRVRVRALAAGDILHRKDDELTYFGIIARGDSRVVNEFENGSVYMIESNHAPDFVGEVALLAEMPRASVTIEATTDMLVAYISRADAERWLAEDIRFLRQVSRKVAYKLYRSSYSNGAKLFYPPSYLLVDFLVRLAHIERLGQDGGPARIVVRRTRQELQEELGVNVKTLNRTIRQLREEGLLGVEHGKVTFDEGQLERALPWLDAARTR